VNERSGYDVVIIGAGVIGLAVALQLRRAGVTDVLVVERNASPGMGSTSRANGGVRAQFSSAVNIAFSRFSIARLAELDDMTRGLVGLRRIGYLFLTGTAAGADALRRAYELQRSLGVAVDWLSADDVAGLAPYVDTRGLGAATFGTEDGIIDPHGVVSALWRQARELGVAFAFDTEISGLEHSAQRVTVRTTHGVIEAGHVVNAAGPSAREAAKLAGLQLPVTSRRRNLACTEGVPGAREAIPMSVDLDTGVLIRREGAGFLIGYSSPDEPPGFDTTFDPTFLDDVAQRIGRRFSFLEGVAINPRKCWAGLYPETADHHAIIDAPATCPRFIQCAGFGGHGIMHSLAAGEAVAELVRDGRCSTFDLHPLRLGRFDDGDLAVETAVL